MVTTLRGTAAISWEYLMPKKRIRAAGYPRCSDPDLHDSPTLESQANAIREHCGKLGYELSEDHMYPEAMSAYMVHYTQRPKLMALLAAAKRKEFDVLVVTEIRAISRRQVEVFVIYDILQKYGIQIETIQEKFEDSPMGRFILATRALVAELERENTYMRTMRGRQDRVNNGYLRGHGKACYRYIFVDVGKECKAHYELNDKVFFVDSEGVEWTEVKVVRFIHQLFLSDESIRGIVTRLNTLQIPPPGKPRKGIPHWQASTVYKILIAREYIGEAHVNKWKREGKRLLRQSYENMTPLPEGVCPAILDKDAFAEVQQRLAFNKQDSIRNNKHPQDLGILRAGFVYCGICGRRLAVKHHNPTPTNSRRKPEYVCQTRTGKPELVVNHFTSISVHIMDQAAWDKAVAVIADPSQVRARLEALREANISQVDTESIEATTAAIKRQLHNLYTLAQAATDDETIESIKGLMNNLEKQKHEAEAMLYDIEEDEEERALIEAKIVRFEQWAEKVQPLLTDPNYQPTYEEKRFAVHILGLRAIVFPGNGDYPFRYQISVDPPEIMPFLTQYSVATDQSRISWGQTECSTGKRGETL
ncbi:MAG: recombinase family protein [Ktedonobacteraceae bacterium]